MAAGLVEALVVEVLVVEDDPGDVLLIREAFADTTYEDTNYGGVGVGRTGRRDPRTKVSTNLSVVGDGAQALAFLRKQGEHATAPVPDFILLDLNLPKVGGREVLATVKADAGLRHIPVVVLTTSGADDDVVTSYRLHANAYITKPADFEHFLAVIRRIEDFFAHLVELPRVDR